MGFLDELENEAKLQREEEERDALALEEKEVFFREVADPTFRQLFDYLKRLTEHLNFLGKRRTVHYPAPGYGTITGHVGDDFKVRFSGNDRRREIDIGGHVDFPRQRLLEVVGEFEVNRIQTFARERGLRTNERTRRDQRGNVVAGDFRLAGRVGIRVLITTSVDDPEFRIAFTNCCGFGQMLKVVPPEQMDESMMDKLGRFIARVDDEFLTEDVGEEIREELAKRLTEERHLKVRELAASDRERRKVEAQQQEQVASARRLANRFQSRLEEGKRKFSDR
ncbi:MAG: hypothetical protein AAGE01_19770 [Pseudomonadota bacterium]